MHFIEDVINTFTANYEISRSKRTYQDCRTTRYLVVCARNYKIVINLR